MKQRAGAGELSDSLVAEVTELCDRGDDDVEHGRYDEAIARYKAALALMPAPVFAWKATSWILTALADAHFFKKDFAATRDAINDAMRCIGAVGNPFLHLRLGQAELELGNRGRARDELHRAYLGGGEDLFAGEDPRYLELVQEQLRREQED